MKNKVFTERELEQWDQYERQMEVWKNTKYESNMEKAMSKPNKPGYFIANND